MVLEAFETTTRSSSSSSSEETHLLKEAAEANSALKYSSRSSLYSDEINESQRERSTLNDALSITQTITVRHQIFLLFLIGTILGVVMPKNEQLPHTFVKYSSAIIGYIYTLCWSVSFYPQIIMNHARKSTTGLSADFSMLNVVGFLCYSIYTISFYCSSSIEKEYENRNDGGQNSVRSNDVAFALHAFLVCSFQMYQIVYYDKRFSWKSLAIGTRCFLIVSALLCLLYVGLILCGSNNLEWIDFLYLSSSIKLAITIIKYPPQVFMNYQRKSTEGWNIHTVLYDFAGGIFSFMQVTIEAIDLNDLNVITGNWVKIGLSLVSLLFDTIFIVQHYVFYPHRKGDEVVKIIL